MRSYIMILGMWVFILGGYLPSAVAQEVNPDLLSEAQLREYIKKLATENRTLRAENGLLRRQIESMKQEESEEEVMALRKEVAALREALKEAGGQLPSTSEKSPDNTSKRPKLADIRSFVEGKWACTYRRGEIVEKEADIFFLEGGAFRRSRHDKRKIIDWNQADERCVWKVLPDGRIRGTAFNNKLPKSDPPRFDYVFDIRDDGTLLGKPLKGSFEQAIITARKADQNQPTSPQK